MLDNQGRNIRYLRLSVTDRCNFRCRYCMPAEGVCKREHSEMLSFEELTEIVFLDPLTGIGNRRYAEVVLEEKMAELSRYGFRFGIRFVQHQREKRRVKRPGGKRQRHAAHDEAGKNFPSFPDGRASQHGRGNVHAGHGHPPRI